MTAPDAVTCAIIPATLSDFEIASDDLTVLVAVGSNAPSTVSSSISALGTYQLTAVAAPEPSSVALMLLGVGLVFVMRKRIGQHLPQAS